MWTLNILTGNYLFKSEMNNFKFQSKFQYGYHTGIETVILKLTSYSH